MNGSGVILEERYGTDAGRVPTASAWAMSPGRGFQVTPEATSLRLRLPSGQPAAWAHRDIVLPERGTVVINARLRCPSELRGPSLVLGVRYLDGATALVRQGGMTQAWNDLGVWGSDAPGTELAGFDTEDWHDLALRLRPAQGMAEVFLDDVLVLTFAHAAVADPRRAELVIGSERPGQVIQLDRIRVADAFAPLRGNVVPAIFDADWSLDGARLATTRIRRRRDPVLVPGDPGAPDAGAAYDAWVLREGRGYRMWYAGRPATPDARLAIHHARSSDGVAWVKEPSGPVFEGGPRGTWDAGGVQGPVVLRLEGGYRMWYAGYLEGARGARVGVATSPDGLRWSRPAVSPAPQGIGGRTNIAYDLQVGPNDDQYVMPQCVVVDPDAPAHRRYTLFVHAQGRECFIEVARSADGWRFERHLLGSRRYAVNAHRPEVGALHQRTAVVRHGDVWVAFFGYVERRPRVSLSTWATAWRVDPTDADPSFGLWRATRQLTPRPGTWEAGFAWPSCAVEDGPRWLLYHTGSVGPFDGAVGVSTMPRGGPWLLRPTGPQGTALSRAIRPPDSGWATNRLRVCVPRVGRGGGRLRVGLEDPRSGTPIPGHDVADAVPIEAGTGEATVRWRGVGERLPDVACELAARVELEGSAGLRWLAIEAGTGG